MRNALLVCMLLATCYCHAQADIHFSQFYETTILRNPALTGVAENNYKATAYYRNQWNSVAQPYETYLLDLEYHVKVGRGNDYASFGLLGYSDKAGDVNQKISGVYPAVNYNKCINEQQKAYLSVGFTAGYLQYSFDPSLATVNNQFVGGMFSTSNPTMETFPNPKRSQFDIGAGINLISAMGENQQATVFFGASAYHFNQPKFSYYNQGFTENTRWNFNAGLITRLSESFRLHVPFNYAAQGAYSEIIGGALLGWHSFAVEKQPQVELYFGALYRVNDAIVPVVKMLYKSLGVGVSYDVNVSTLHPASQFQGGLELAISVSGNYPRQYSEYKMTACPRF